MSRTVLSSVLALVALVCVGTRFSNSQIPGGIQANGLTSSDPTSSGNESMLMYSGRSSVGAHQVILVDTAKRVMAVYFISPDTGIIQLKSVRNLSADLQLEEFNGSDPSPAKVRSILAQP